MSNKKVDIGLKPIANQIIFKAEFKRKTDNGIILPENKHTVALIGEIIAVGESCKYVKEGQLVSLRDGQKEIVPNNFNLLYFEEEKDKEYAYVLASEGVVALIIEDKKALEKITSIDKNKKRESKNSGVVNLNGSN